MITFARVFLTLSCIVLVLGDDDDGLRSVYETAEIIESDGYVAETHGVLTPDGYMLEMYRIPYMWNQTRGPRNRPVVFLMHGLMAASFSFISLGPNLSIAYNLADAGFDVWMGNARGTKNSRKHINLNPDYVRDKNQFFDFSWEEIGYYDIANMIDYILQLTYNDKLHYIGHSQGGTTFLVLNSMRPEYNDKILSAHLLAGVGYMNYFPNQLLRSLAMFTNTVYLDWLNYGRGYGDVCTHETIQLSPRNSADRVFCMALALRLKILEIFPPSNFSTNNSLRMSDDNVNLEPSERFEFDCDKDEACRAVDYCTGDIQHKEMCELFGIEEILTPQLLDNNLVDYGLGGAATKQFAHFGQNIQDKAFRRWNYGAMENFRKYGSHIPPTYDLSRITVNTTMHYTISDNLLDERDVIAMCSDMPNCVVRRISRDSFLHLDFIFAGDVKDMVTDYMIKKIWDAHDTFLLPNPPTTKNPDGPNFNNTNVTDGSSSLLPSILLKAYISILITYLLLLQN